ncbi:MAG TPA: putative glycoside hydrolase [Solirubrobacteraceae bacterium]
MLGGSGRRVLPAVHGVIAVVVVFVTICTMSAFAAGFAFTKRALAGYRVNSQQLRGGTSEQRTHRSHARRHHRHRHKHHKRGHVHKHHGHKHRGPHRGSPTQIPPTGTLVPGSSPALFNREVLQFPAPPNASQGRYNVMVLQSTESKYIPILRRLNPHMEIFMYMFTMWANPADPQGLELCTALSQDLPHPNWFLRDAAGTALTRSGNYEMDPGNPGYQQACASHVIGMAKQLGFDGVNFDGINTRLAYALAPGTSSPQYPNDPSWQAAMYSFLTNVGAAIHASGLKVIGNIGGATAAIWRQWNGPLDGAEEESWTNGNFGFLQQVPAWPQKLGDAAWSEANGKIMLVHSYDTTEAGNTYGLASMMLVAGGHVSYSTTNTGIVNYEVWYPEYTDAQQLGAPLGSYQRLSNGVYERRFAKGIVLSNPSAAPVGAFSLGGGVYSGSGLSSVGSASMGPTSGLILLRVG